MQIFPVLSCDRHMEIVYAEPKIANIQKGLLATLLFKSCRSRMSCIELFFRTRKYGEFRPMQSSLRMGATSTLSSRLTISLLRRASTFTGHAVQSPSCPRREGGLFQTAVGPSTENCCISERPQPPPCTRGVSWRQLGSTRKGWGGVGLGSSV